MCLSSIEFLGFTTEIGKRVQWLPIGQDPNVRPYFPPEKKILYSCNRRLDFSFMFKQWHRCSWSSSLYFFKESYHPRLKLAVDCVLLINTIKIYYQVVLNKVNYIFAFKGGLPYYIYNPNNYSIRFRFIICYILFNFLIINCHFRNYKK